MAKVVAVCNQKGGVGKTTTTVNIGAGLAREGKSVLLIDADSQGDLTTSLGWRNQDELDNTIATMINNAMNDRETGVRQGILHHEEGIDLIPANIELSSMEMQLVTAMSRESILKNIINDVRDDYDYIIIDCSPSLGMMTINALAAADEVIIPVQAQYLPTKGMTQLLQTVSRVSKHINNKLQIGGILITLADGRTRLTTEIRGVLENSFGKYINIYSTNIPCAVAAAKAASSGKSIYEFDPKSPVAAAYQKITESILAEREIEREGR